MQSQALKSEPDQDESDLAHMEAMSHGFEDFILDCSITIEEIESASKETEYNKKWES